MAKYHDTGTICKAEKRPCPLGLSDGDHIEAADEKEFEKKLAERMAATLQGANTIGDSQWDEAASVAKLLSDSSFEYGMVIPPERLDGLKLPEEAVGIDGTGRIVLQTNSFADMTRVQAKIAGVGIGQADMIDDPLPMYDKNGEPRDYDEVFTESYNEIVEEHRNWNKTIRSSSGFFVDRNEIRFLKDLTQAELDKATQSLIDKPRSLRIVDGTDYAYGIPRIRYYQYELPEKRFQVGMTRYTRFYPGLSTSDPEEAIRFAAKTYGWGEEK